jgi:tetratricopeptide (TPR) repeat protein
MKKLITLSLLLVVFHSLNAQKLEIARNGNLRTNPNISSKVIGKVSIGMKGTQLDYSLGWYKIELTNKTTGWIYQILVKRDKPWDNDRAMKFFLQARNKSKEKDYKSALADLDSTTLYNPELYDAWIMAGFINGMLDKTAAANEAFSMAIEIDPKKPDGYFNRGRVFAVSGDNEKACADWKLAEKLGSTEAREFIDEFCTVKTNTTNEYIGHISEIATYPSMIIAGDCPFNALI